MKLRKGDNIKMLSGKDRNKTGKILSVHKEENRVVVEGLNLMKKHIRPRQQGQKGQIISKERAISAASVALICKSCGKATRIGYKINGDNKTRVCKKCGGEV